MNTETTGQFTLNSSEKIKSSQTGFVSVWTIHLGLGTLPALLRTFLRCGSFQLKYTASSWDGRILAALLRTVRILATPAKHVEFSLHGLRVDDAQSNRLLVQSWLPNQFTDLFMHVNEAVMEKFVYPDSRVCREKVIINIRKAAAQTTVDALALLELAKYHHRIEEDSYSKLVLITPHAVLAHLFPKEWIGEDVRFIAPWSRHYSLVLRLGRSILRFLRSLKQPKKPRLNHPPSIAAAAAWGVNRSERLNDLFWWWDSDIPANRTILFFDRRDSGKVSETLGVAAQSGIMCVALNQDAAGDSPHLLWEAKPGFITSTRRIWRSFRILAWGIFRGRSRQWIARQTMDMMYSSERMEDFLEEFNVRGLFHHQDGGLDYQSLACDAVGAARIGHHWSYFPWPETAVARLHQVYFVWGPYQAEMLEATGSQVDHVLWSGCTVNGASLNNNTTNTAYTDRSAIEANGASRVIALFDTSLPCQGFYEYFLEKVILDQRWGLLIKPKNAYLPWSRYNLTRLGDLVEKALATGRVRVLEHMTSPVQAAAVADFSVAVDINSAAVCAALAGHRAIHLDYTQVHSSPLEDWATLYKAGPDRLVFDNPDVLWEKLNLYYDDHDTVNTLGVADDSVLAHIDPFRDGRAGERIGQYLYWYLQALDAGMERDPALEQANTQYATAWGERAVVSGPIDSSDSSLRAEESKGIDVRFRNGKKSDTVSGIPK